jgi:UDP-glucose 4-epimerase
MKILVTGGAGYIGSVTAKALEAAGHTPVILDSLLTGPREFVRDRAFYDGDIADRQLLGRVVAEHADLDCTIHMRFGSSYPSRRCIPTPTTATTSPSRWSCSTSCADSASRPWCSRPRPQIYVAIDGLEVTEESPLDARSPYARNKQMMEQMLQDMSGLPTCAPSSCATSIRSAPTPTLSRVSTQASPRTSSAS